MPIAGVVVTMAEGEREQLMAALAATAGVSLGGPIGARLPVVLEAETPKALDAALRELGTLRGVLFVELAYADVPDEEALLDYEPPKHERAARGGTDGPA